MLGHIIFLIQKIENERKVRFQILNQKRLNSFKNNKVEKKCGCGICDSELSLLQKIKKLFGFI